MLALQPFYKQPSIFDYFDNFDRLFDVSAKPSFAPVKSDIIENDNCYVLSAELPGFTKDEINIDIKDNILTIEASHSSESDSSSDEEGNENAEEKAPVNYICKERSSVSYKRSFNVEGVDVANIGAKLENGVLELNLPKMAPKEPEKITISVA
ncbi:MAG: Hsp20/alpha crystallin family protein [Lachnospiraceae bacterium]|nr:Hsp20/alpha crystallin family protein [Lachnospiraceae bacterium]